MDGKIRNTLTCLSILLILPLCLFTGGNGSPARFLYYPLVILLCRYLNFRLLLGIGISYSLFFPVIFFLQKHAFILPPNFPAENLSYFLAAIAAGCLARKIQLEHERYENAISTFHSLSDDLNNKNMNLQTTLDALSSTHKKLKEYDQNRTKFLSNVSHELRTPLSSIRSYSEILLNYDDIDNDTGRDFILIINKESERLTTLVNEVLDLVKIESGRHEFNISGISPTVLLEESEKIIKPMALNKGLHLVLDRCAKIPEIQGDQNQLIQVLVNLLNNAVKYTVEGTITCGVRQGGEFAEFFVSDTGEGIFPEEREVIFDEFYRICEVGLNRPKGSGLGLSISRKIVEYHGGRIWVESEVGKGSTFYFTVPLFSDKTQRIIEPVNLNVERCGKNYGPILVLSNDTVVRRTLRKKIEELGYYTLGTDTPQRALQMASEMKPRLIILDDAENCDDFLEILRWAKNSQVQAFLVSLFTCNFGEEPRLALHGYISKPFDKYEITSLLELHNIHRGRLVLISPEKEESRTLQVILNTTGYDLSLFDSCSMAVQACINSSPDGLIIGSFQKKQVQEFVLKLKSNARTCKIPIFLVLGFSIHKYAKTVTLDKTCQTTNKDGLYKLIGEIESAYSKCMDEV
jgi:signal transduction histidine kinase/CheY-like chemotaxis protein